MEIFKLYENVLREEEIGQKVQTCIRMFGDELFGDQLMGDEPNTPTEDGVANSIKSFTMTSYGRRIPKTNPTFIVQMKALQNCMSTYPEVLLPGGETVYRGIKYNFNQLLELYKKVHGKPNFRMLYKAHSYVQSWSENYSIARGFGYSAILQNDTIHDIKLYLNADIPKENGVKFHIEGANLPFGITVAHAKKYIGYHNFGIILNHKATPDSFLFKAKYFNYLKHPDLSANEDEILRLGNEPLLCDWEIGVPEVFTLLIPFMMKYTDYFENTNLYENI